MAKTEVPIKREEDDDEGGSDLALRHFNCDLSDLYEAEKLCQTLEDLNALKISIETYGITQELLSFADHNKILSTNVTGIPSLEAFTSTPAKYTSEVALEGLLHKIGETSARWWAAVKAHIKKYELYYRAALSLVIAALYGIALYYSYMEQIKRQQQYRENYKQWDSRWKSNYYGHRSSGDSKTYESNTNPHMQRVKDLIITVNQMIESLSRETNVSFRTITSGDAMGIINECEWIANKCKDIIKRQEQEIEKLDIISKHSGGDEKNITNALAKSHRIVQSASHLSMTCKRLAKNAAEAYGYKGA